jgi:phosphoglycolate phosphatase-like HAD superfamily hydrolase
MSIQINRKRELDIEIDSNYIILCDMDGTLINTDYANYLSYNRAIEEVVSQSYDLQYNSEKRFTRKVLKEKISYLSPDQYNEIISLKTNYYNEYLAETKVNPTIAEFIKKISKINETFLVTLCRERRAVETLEYHNLLNCFSRLICWEDLSKIERFNKYASALYLLKTNPIESIVCENDKSDIRKALTAGIPRKNIISIV